MQEWTLGLSAAKVALTVIAMMCGALALYVRLTVESQLSKFLEKLGKKLDDTYVRKDVHAAEMKALDVTAGDRPVIHARS
jgi:hypothetical protein